MKEAILNGVCVFFGAIAGNIAEDMLGIILPWPALAAVAGGIITVITAAAALTAVQLHKMAGVYKRAAGRITEEGEK